MMRRAADRGRAQPAKPAAQPVQRPRGLAPAAAGDGLPSQAASRLHGHVQERGGELIQACLVDGKQPHGAVTLPRRAAPQVADSAPQGHSARIMPAEHAVQRVGQQFGHPARRCPLAPVRVHVVGGGAAPGDAFTVHERQREADGRQRVVTAHSVTDQGDPARSVASAGTKPVSRPLRPAVRQRPPQRLGHQRREDGPVGMVERARVGVAVAQGGRDVEGHPH
jgi:hypothetical protein